MKIDSWRLINWLADRLQARSGEALRVDRVQFPQASVRRADRPSVADR